MDAAESPAWTDTSAPVADAEVPALSEMPPAAAVVAVLLVLSPVVIVTLPVAAAVLLPVVRKISPLGVVVVAVGVWCVDCGDGWWERGRGGEGGGGG